MYYYYKYSVYIRPHLSSGDDMSKCILVGPVPVVSSGRRCEPGSCDAALRRPPSSRVDVSRRGTGSPQRDLSENVTLAVM